MEATYGSQQENMHLFYFFFALAFVLLALQLEGWGYNPALREALNRQYFGHIRGKRTVRNRVKHAGDVSRHVK